MARDRRSTRNERHNELLSAIGRQTQGRLTNLTLDDVGGALSIEADCSNYHGVQLALAAIEAFSARSPQTTFAKLSFCVDGHLLVLHEEGGQNNEKAGKLK
jgi:hypothetical protein